MSPELTRRRLLAGAALLGAGYGYERLTPPLDGVHRAATPPPEGVVVSDAHLAAARDRYLAAVEDAKAAVEAVEPDPAMNGALTSADEYDPPENPADEGATRWDRLDGYRGGLRSAVNRWAYLRAWNGDLTRSDVRGRIDASEVPEPTDTYRGSDPERALVQAQYAEWRLFAATQYRSYVTDAADDIAGETAADVPDTSEFAAPVAISLRELSRAEAYVEDARFLRDAVTDGPDRHDQFAAAYERFRDRTDAKWHPSREFDGVRALEVLSPQRHLTDPSPQRSREVAAELRAEGYLAAATAAVARGYLVQTVGESLWDAEFGDDREALSAAAEDAASSFAAVRRGSPLERELFRTAAPGLERVRRVVDGNGPFYESRDLHSATVHLRAAERIADAASSVARTFRLVEA